MNARDAIGRFCLYIRVIRVYFVNLDATTVFENGTYRKYFCRSSTINVAYSSQGENVLILRPVCDSGIDNYVTRTISKTT